MSDVKRYWAPAITSIDIPPLVNGTYGVVLASDYDALKAERTELHGKAAALMVERDALRAALEWIREVPADGCTGAGHYDCINKAAQALAGATPQPEPVRPTMLWPRTFAECNLASEVRIEVSDIADYSYPPGRRKRYTWSGWGKAIHLGVAELNVADFGALVEPKK